MSENASIRLDIGAPFSGLLAATGTLAVGSLLIGLATFLWPAADGVSAYLQLGLQGLAALAAGARAGRRAAAVGLWHGLLTGVLLIATLSLVDAVRLAAPTAPDLLRRGSLLLAAGALGGILGVNSRR